MLIARPTPILGTRDDDTTNQFLIEVALSPTAGQRRVREWGEIPSWAKTIAEDLTDNSGSTPAPAATIAPSLQFSDYAKAAASLPQRLRFSGRNTTHDAIDVRGPDMPPRWKGGAPDACGRLL